MSDFIKRWIVPAISWIIFLNIIPTHAEEALVEKLSERWRWRSFETEPQLPVGLPTAIGHDSSGMIYVGSLKGVYRYTGGFRWEHIPSAEGETPFPILQFLESDRQVYLRTRNALWAIRYGELYKVIEGGDYLFAAGPHGGIHVIDRVKRELYRIRSDQNVLAKVGDFPFAKFGKIADYAIDNKRVHWLATSEGLFRGNLQSGSSWKKETSLPAELKGLPCQFVEVVKFQPLYRDQHTHHVEGDHLDTEFEIWATFNKGQEQSFSARLTRTNDSEKHDWEAIEVEQLDRPLQGVIRDGKGQYYSLTQDGSLYFSPYGIHWQKAKDLGIGQVKLSSGIVDSYGLIWFAYDVSMGVGSVAWYDPLSRRWERVPGSEKLKELKVLSMLQASDGSQFLGAVDGLYQLADDEIHERKLSGKDVIEQVSGLAEDPYGNVWLSSGDSFSGAFRLLSGDGPLERPVIIDEISNVPIVKIVPDRNRNLWFLPTKKLPGEKDYKIFQLKFSRFSGQELEPFTLPVGPANDFLEAQNGSKWVATENGLVHFPKEGKPKIYQAGHDSSGSELLRSNRIWAVANNRADGSIWISYVELGFGVSRFLDGRFTHYDESTGLKGAKVWSIDTTLPSFGYRVWVGTQNGLSCFDGDGWYNYPLPVSSANNRSPTVYTLTRSRDSEDFIQMGTLGGGAFRFRLENPRRPRFLTKLKMENLKDGSIKFSWEARDFKSQTPHDELFYRYRIDKSPFSEFTRRTSVTYRAKESGGEHTLQVEVRDRDGVPALQDLSERFNFVKPPLFSTFHWVLISIGGAILLGLLLYFGIRSFRRWRLPLLKLKSAFSGLSHPVFLVDRKGRILEYNGKEPDLLKLEDLDKNKLQGLPINMVPIFHDSKTESRLKRMLDGEIIELEIPGFEDEPTLKVRGLPVVFNPSTSSKVEGALVYVEDITQNSQRDQNQRRQRRMIAIKELTRRLGDSLDQAAVETEDLSSMGTLLSALKSFSGNGVEDSFHEITLPSFIETILSDDQEIGVPRSIDLDLRSPTGLWTIEGAESSLKEAFTQVIKNAIEAMRGEGKLTIRFANRRLEQSKGDLKPGRYVEVTIEDTGLGLDPVQLECAFDPLFTTKSTHQHEGLGLSVALGIISSHGGDIWMESNLSNGTTVRIYLPVVES